MRFSFSQVRSLAGQTDLFLQTYRGVLRERSDYIVLETPSNPSFFWGNYLYFRNAPKAGDLARWMDFFRREFAHQPEIRHYVFAWDESNPGENEEFLSHGFLAETSSVLSLENLELREPLRKFTPLKVRPLQTEADWEAATENQIACRPEGWKIDSYTTFKRQHMNSYRRMQEEGHGHWWGGFLDETLVAECGLFYSGNIGRFQSVGTNPDYRRRGICGSMIHLICQAAQTRNPSLTLVIVADEGEPADRIYRSVGFRPNELRYTLSHWPKEEWSN